MSKVAAIGIDIGGTQIKAVAVDGEGTVLGRRQADTSNRAEILFEGLKQGAGNFDTGSRAAGQQ